MVKYKLLVHSVQQLVQVVTDGQRVKNGKQMSHVDVLEGDNTGYSILVNRYKIRSCFVTYQMFVLYVYK